MIGIVKWFSRDRGYGFINTPALPGIDVLAHYSDILDDGRPHDPRRNLSNGDSVSFEVVPNIRDGRYKGQKAIQVKVLP